MNSIAFLPDQGNFCPQLLLQVCYNLLCKLFLWGIFLCKNLGFAFLGFFLNRTDDSTNFSSLNSRRQAFKKKKRSSKFGWSILSLHDIINLFHTVWPILFQISILLNLTCFCLTLEYLIPISAQAEKQGYFDAI